MTNNEKEKALKYWENILADKENAHNEIRKGSSGVGGEICEFLAEKIINYPYDLFFSDFKMKEIPTNGYYKEERGGKRADNSNRGEDLNSIWLQETYPNIVIDRQIPLEDGTKTNADLLLFNDGVLFFGEAKKEDTNETILRALIEVERYYRFLHHDKLIEEIKCKRPDLNINNNKVQKAILVFNKKGEVNSQGKQTKYLLEQLNSPEYSNTQKLMKLLHTFAIDADELQKGKIKFIDGYSPNDYEFV